MSTITRSIPSKVSYVSIPSPSPKSNPTILVVKLLPIKSSKSNKVNVFKVDDNGIYSLSMTLQSSRCCNPSNVEQKITPVGISKDEYGNPIYTPLDDDIYGVLKVNESQFLTINSEYSKGFDTLAIYRDNPYVSLWFNPKSGTPSVTISIYSSQDGLTFTI